MSAAIPKRNERGMGFYNRAMAEGYACVGMTIGPVMLNGHGSAHGEMIFALADTTLVCACNCRNVATVAQYCSIAFVDAGRPGERLVPEATERIVKGRTGVYGVTVFGEDGRIIAEMQGLSRTIGGLVVEDNL